MTAEAWGGFNMHTSSIEFFASLAETH